MATELFAVQASAVSVRDEVIMAQVSSVAVRADEEATQVTVAELDAES